MILILLCFVLLAGCASKSMYTVDCFLLQKRAMQGLEPYSVASDTFVMRDDEEGSYIRLEPGRGFTEPMRRALATWELTKLECWGEEL